MTSRVTRIYIVEDHAVMCEMLADAIARMPELQLVGMSTTAEAALDELARTEVDLVLVDVSLPRMSGVDLVRTLKQSMPTLPCLMISGHVEVGYAEQALDAGACGYVLKGRPDDLEAGIRAAIVGKRYLSEPLQKQFSPD